MKQSCRILLKTGLFLGLLWLTAACARQPIAPSIQRHNPLYQRRDGMVAFIRDNALWIQTGNDESTAIAVDRCADNNCRIAFPKWSPDGNYLLYYWSTLDGPNTGEIRLVDRSGAVQTVTQNAAFIRPADWSPDGASIVYLLNTERMNTATGPGNERILEVWTVDLAADGTLQKGEQRGEIGFGEGCGGGGRSASAEAYEREGGFAYGYLAGVVEWTPTDLLLFSNNCGSRGVGRFDLAGGELLDPYSGGLRSLTLNAAGTSWAALNPENQIVVGTPERLDYTVVPTDQAPEMVFYGPVSGRLYYTTLTVTGDYTDLVDTVSALSEEINVSPYFDTVQPALYAFDEELATATLLYEENDYAYARLTESADGSLLFARVENGDELYAAIENGTLTVENQTAFLPQVDVIQMTWADGAAPTANLWLANAAQFAFSPGSGAGVQ